MQCIPYDGIVFLSNNLFMLAKSGYISLLKMQIIEFPPAKHNKTFLIAASSGRVIIMSWVLGA